MKSKWHKRKNLWTLNKKFKVSTFGTGEITGFWNDKEDYGLSIIDNSKRIPNYYSYQIEQNIPIKQNRYILVDASSEDKIFSSNDLKVVIKKNEIFDEKILMKK